MVCGGASCQKQLHGLVEASAATSQLVNPAAHHCCTPAVATVTLAAATAATAVTAVALAAGVGVVLVQSDAWCCAE